MIYQSLWGKPNFEGDPNSPMALLQEQVQFLDQATGGRLIGKVYLVDPLSSTDANFGVGLFTIGGDPQAKTTVLHVELSLVAPKLNNYKLVVLRLAQEAAYYPLKVESRLDGTKVTCKDQDELINALRTILGSQSVTNMIERLVSQIKTLEQSAYTQPGYINPS